MNELLTRVAAHKTVAVVGLAKNTGKTVTVNYLVAGASAAGLRLGLTSTGRDGETEDILTSLPKPAIYLPQGTVLATARGSLVQGTARLEILDTTGVSNTLGEIIIARVREAGSVEVSGPERTRDLSVVIDILQSFSDLVIVDGALDRIAASAPAVTRATILATGAVIGENIARVVETTVHTVRVLMTPSAHLTSEAAEIVQVGKSGVVNKSGVVKILPFPTVVHAPPQLLDYLDADFNCLLLGGALTNELAEMLTAAAPRLNNPEVVVRDGTRIFVEPRPWQRLLRRANVKVLERINLVAVTVNPVGRRGRQLPARELVSTLQKFMPGLLVLDPLAGGGA